MTSLLLKLASDWWIICISFLNLLSYLVWNFISITLLACNVCLYKYKYMFGCLIVKIHYVLQYGYQMKGFTEMNTNKLKCGKLVFNSIHQYMCGKYVISSRVAVCTDPSWKRGNENSARAFNYVFLYICEKIIFYK